MRIAYVYVFAIALLPGSSLLTRATAAEPEEILLSKGLTRMESVYVLEGDRKLPEDLRVMRAAKAKEDAYKAKHAAMERQLKAAYATVESWEAQYEAMTQRMANIKKGNYQNDPRPYNAMVAQHNALENNINQSQRLIDEKRKELDELKDPRDEYLSAVLELSARMEDTAKRYEELAADAQVQAALAKLSETSRRKLKLGPSPAFALELPRVRKLRTTMVSAPIKVTFVGGTPHVPVTINGKVTQTMAVDSGAAVVNISWHTAEQAGVTPGPSDPTIGLELAAGKVAEGKLMVIESVRVGPFIVHNVECVVYPQSAGEVSGLLGDSFLRHFVYKSNLAAGELQMTQLDEPRTAAATRPTARNGAGGAHPSPNARDFSVPSASDWTATNCTVQAGQCYEIKARGKWTGAAGEASGPQGLCPPELLAVLGPQPALTQEQRDILYLGQHPRNALIGKIGSEKWSFYVGAECRFLAPLSGPLSFRMNDTNSASTDRAGQVDLTIRAITPEWINHNGQVEILARIDDHDRLHLTPAGIYWEYGGAGGKVGLHDGYYPTVVNGIYWWPKWADDKYTATLPVPDLWPQNPARLKIARVEAERGKVEFGNRDPQDVAITFSDDGIGSSQVGCVLTTGNRIKPPETPAGTSP